MQGQQQRRKRRLAPMAGTMHVHYSMVSHVSNPLLAYLYVTLSMVHLPLLKCAWADVRTQSNRC
jgi:hypothetical protein